MELHSIGAVALSSAEAEFYAMIEAVIRSKGSLSTMKEVGFVMAERVQLYTDSSAAKSFVSRRGLGKMKHLEIRDLWLQRKVGRGSVVDNKVEGPKNPADLMTKYLKRCEIDLRLRLMGIRVEWEEDDQLSAERLTAEVNLLGWSMLRKRCSYRSGYMS